MPAAGRVIVVGSANIDHVIDVDRLPRAGETVLGRGLTTTGGGKGANQAVAAARDGAQVAFVGAVGADAEGATVLRDLAAEGIDGRAVQRRTDAATGAAFITVDSAGQNTIVVASGANASLDAATTRASLASLDIQPADVCLLSFELPIATVVAAAELAAARGCALVINPAPALPVPDALLRTRPILTPNALEASELGAASDPEQAAQRLASRTGRWVVVTLGGDGALLADPTAVRRVAGWTVPVLDTTGAGDTFSGVLAAALARAESPDRAVRRANAAAALSVGSVGARPGMPRSEAIDALLATTEGQVLRVPPGAGPGSTRGVPG
ncbi:MAG: ribokinase [Chloroflexota bacterium]